MTKATIAIRMTESHAKAEFGFYNPGFMTCGEGSKGGTEGHCNRSGSYKFNILPEEPNNPLSFNTLPIKNSNCQKGEGLGVGVILKRRNLF